MVSSVAFFASHGSCQQRWDSASHVFVYALETTHSLFVKTKEAVLLVEFSASEFSVPVCVHG